MIEIKRNRKQHQVLVVLFGTLAMACGDDTRVCPLIQIASVHGNVLDRDGKRVVPDRVLIQDHRGTFECDVEAPETGLAGYTCWAGAAGPAVVTAHVGDEQVSQPLWLYMNESGCHVVTQRVDLQLE